MSAAGEVGSGLQLGRMVLGPVQTNCYFLFYGEDGVTPGENPEKKIPVLLVDPPDNGEYIYDRLSGHGFSIAKILLTHAHFDHIGGIAGIETRAKENGEGHIPVTCAEPEAPICRDPMLNCSIGMGDRGITVEPDELLKDNEIIKEAGLTARVIYTPGHTVGGCCFYFEDAGVLISGDTLFCQSVGRSDLPTGNMSTMIRSIKERLLILPDETVVLPGHGEETTIGDEKRLNFFIQ